jgi:PadR family transcriptional regulator, regulatory protein PadR
MSLVAETGMRLAMRRCLTYLAQLCMIPSMDLSKDLVAASASPIFLSLLDEGESYGYAILQRVRELSGGEVEWTDGMLYPVLHRLEAAGQVKSRWEVGDSNRRRKYYRLTNAGRRALASQRSQWLFVHGVLTKLWGVQPCSISKLASANGASA